MTSAAFGCGGNEGERPWRSTAARIHNDVVGRVEGASRTGHATTGVAGGRAWRREEDCSGDGRDEHVHGEEERDGDERDGSERDGEESRRSERDRVEHGEGACNR